MKKLFLFLLCVFGSACSPLWAHSDWIASSKYGNVSVAAQYGFYEHEERNKALIIAQYVELLAEQMDYQQPVGLFFEHSYVEGRQPEYRVFYGKGPFPQGDTVGINICQYCKYYNLEQTLQLVEYAMQHEEYIKAHQKDTIVPWRNVPTMTRTITMVDNALINKVLSKPLSTRIRGVMAQKIYRPESKYPSDLSYYMADGKYYVFYKYRERISGKSDEWQDTEKVLKEMDYIYQYSRVPFDPSVGTCKAMVFDTDSSFYYFDKKGILNPELCLISSRQVIQGLSRYYMPFRVLDIGDGKVAIYKERMAMDEGRTMIYRSEDDRLIQDLDKLMDGHLDSAYYSVLNPRTYLDTLFQKYPGMTPSGYFYFLRRRYPALDPALQNKFLRLDSMVSECPSFVKPCVYTLTPCRVDSNKINYVSDGGMWFEVSPFQPGQKKVDELKMLRNRIFQKYKGRPLPQLSELERQEWIIAKAGEVVAEYAPAFCREGDHIPVPELSFFKVEKEEVAQQDWKRCKGRYYYRVRFKYDPEQEGFGRDLGRGDNPYSGEPETKDYDDDYSSEVCIWADTGKPWKITAGGNGYVIDFQQGSKKQQPLLYYEGYIRDAEVKEKFIADYMSLYNYYVRIRR